MSRRLNFRAWSDSKNKYVDSSFIIVTTEGTLSSLDEPYILEQDTGLKDKNGKEIYEGDILKVRLPEGGPKNQNFVGYGCGGWKEDQYHGEHNYKYAEIIVEYDTDCAMFKTYDHQKKTEPLAFLNLTVCEIVGNIHETENYWRKEKINEFKHRRSDK